MLKKNLIHTIRFNTKNITQKVKCERLRKQESKSRGTYNVVIVNGVKRGGGGVAQLVLAAVGSTRLGKLAR